MPVAFYLPIGKEKKWEGSKFPPLNTPLLHVVTKILGE